MFCIFKSWNDAAYLIFALSIISFVVSLIISLVEIILSVRALELALSDMEEMTRSNFFGEVFGSKEE